MTVRRTLLSLIALFVAGLSAPTQASQITQIVEIVPNNIFSESSGAFDVGGDAENRYFNSVQFQQFDDSLGSLTMVSVDLFASADFSLEIEAEHGPDPGFLNADLSTAFCFTLTDIFECVDPFRSPIVIQDAGFCDVCVVEFSLLAEIHGDVTEDLDAFIGSQLVPIYYLTELEANGGPGFSAGFDALVVDMGMTVTYTYAPVPEPSTALMLALGLAGLATVRTKRSK